MNYGSRACLALSILCVLGALRAVAAAESSERYTIQRRILSRDADFENAASAIAAPLPLRDGLFSSWQPRGVSSETLVRRDATADFGGQYLQLSANGGVWQSVTLAPGTYPLLNLHVRLRNQDTAGGYFYISAEIGSDSTSWERIQNPNPLQLLAPPLGANPKPIASERIPSDRWQSYVLRLQNVTVSSGKQIRISFFVKDVMTGAILVDRAYLEEIDLAGGVQAPNLSFESPVIDDAMTADAMLARRVLVNRSVSPFAEEGWDEASSWYADAPPLVVRNDGGHTGAQYLQAQGGPRSGYYVGQYNLDGAFLEPRAVFPKRDFARYGTKYSSSAYGNYDYRFALSVKARFSGSESPIAPPSSPTNSVPAQAFFLNFNAFSCPGQVPLISRMRVPFSALERDFKAFALHVDPLPVARVVNRRQCFVRGKDNFNIRLSAVSPLNPASNLDFDDLHLDRIAPPELFQEGPWIVVGTNRNVPNWFKSAWRGKEHKEADTKFFLYLPTGIRLEKTCGKKKNQYCVGSDPDIDYSLPGASPDIGGPQFWVAECAAKEIEGERFACFRVRFKAAHDGSLAVTREMTRFGAFYLKSDLPPGTRTHLYYQTQWQAGAWGSAGKETPLRELEIHSKEFPVLRQPQFLVSSIYFMPVSSQLGWPQPGFLKEYGEFGFNTVMSHTRYDGYCADVRGRRCNGNPSNPEIPTEVATHLANARDAGYMILGYDSSFYSFRGNRVNGKDYDGLARDAAGQYIGIRGAPVTKEKAEPCASFGLSRIADYTTATGVKDAPAIDALYRRELNRIANYVKKVRPEYLHTDIEDFPGTAVDSAPAVLVARNCDRCQRYRKRLAAELGIPGAEIETRLPWDETLRYMGLERAKEIIAALQSGRDALAEHELPELSLYQSAPGESVVYDGLWDLKFIRAKLREEGIRIRVSGAEPYYAWPIKKYGEIFREQQNSAMDTIATMGEETPFFPIIAVGSLDGDIPVAQERTYDLIHEFFGSGARGVLWFAYTGIQGGHLYYYSKAMEELLPFEEVIAKSTPLVRGFGKGESRVRVVSPTDGSFSATGIHHRNEYIFLLSSYRDAGGGVQDFGYEVDPYQGDVVLQVMGSDGQSPMSFTGTPQVLGSRATGKIVGAKKDTIVIPFEPNLRGTRTLLVRLCNEAEGQCADPQSGGKIAN